MAGEPCEPVAPTVRDIQSDCCTVTYQSPLVEGLSPVIGYLVKYKTPDSPWTSVTKHLITDTSVRLRELRSGTQYVFQVAAVNSDGTSKYSPASVSVAISYNKPITQPSCPVISSDGRSVDLEWTMPCNDSELNFIILIRYHSHDTDGRMFVTTERKDGPLVRHSLTVELKREVFYDFAVAAVNEAGVGPYSAASQPVRFLTGLLVYLNFLKVYSATLTLTISKCSKLSTDWLFVQ